MSQPPFPKLELIEVPRPDPADAEKTDSSLEPPELPTLELPSKPSVTGPIPPPFRGPQPQPKRATPPSVPAQAQVQAQAPMPAPAPITLQPISAEPDEDDEPTDTSIEIPAEMLSRPAQAATPISSIGAGSTPPLASPTLVTIEREVTGTNLTLPALGPIESFMKDPSITEIMINDLRNVMIERDGKLVFSGFSYTNIEDLNHLTQSILDAAGKTLTSEQPYVDAMLPDGSRVNIVGPPITVGGPCLTIRKFPARRLTIEDLMASEMLDRRIGYFLNFCVLGRVNILISGGTGTGKTTLLNVLTDFVPKGERIVTIEDTPELTIPHPNSVRLQSKPSTKLDPGISARDLVTNALRMRPDRIIVGECRKAEAIDMLQAMNTGHAGSMTTIHANSPRDALMRLETLCMMAGTELPVVAIRKQMASALDLIIQIKRFRNGKRRITAISEVTGMESDTITLQDIFTFRSSSDDPKDPEKNGKFRVTGFVPAFLERLREQGLELPANYFG